MKKQVTTKSLKRNLKQDIKDSYHCDQQCLSFNNIHLSKQHIDYISNQPWTISMKELWLWSDGIDNDGIRILTSASWPLLEKLNLNDNKFTKLGVQYLVRNSFPNLQQFDIWNKIGNQGMKSLSKHNWRSLSNLIVNKCEIASQGLKNFVQYDNSTNLVLIFMNFNKIEPMGVMSLMETESHLTKINTINVRYNLINRSFWKFYADILPKGWNIY